MRAKRTHALGVILFLIVCTAGRACSFSPHLFVCACVTAYKSVHVTVGCAFSWSEHETSHYTLRVAPQSRSGRVRCGTFETMHVMRMRVRVHTFNEVQCARHAAGADRRHNIAYNLA